jgi:hypothetical protein
MALTGRSKVADHSRDLAPALRRTRHNVRPRVGHFPPCAEQKGEAMDLQVPIVVIDELTESVVRATATLDLASGEIRNLQYEDYDVGLSGLPAEDQSYEFTSGTLSNMGRDVEFRVEVDVMSGKYSVTASELLELKGRAAKLFTRGPG